MSLRGSFLDSAVLWVLCSLLPSVWIARHQGFHTNCKDFSDGDDFSPGPWFSEFLSLVLVAPS